MTGIDFADERFIDSDYLEAHRRRELPIDPFSGEHPGIVVATCGQAAWVDGEIAELVYWMWRVGVRTTNSCQDFLDDPADQRIFLAFEHPDDLCLFLSLVAPQDDEPGGLWDRASGFNLAEDDNGRWDYEAGPVIRGRKVALHLSAVLPHSDGPELVSRLRQYARHPK
jgi:hypothetical protein